MTELSVKGYAFGDQQSIESHSHELGDLAADIQYLARDPRHETEKPYYLHYTYDHPLPRTNTRNEIRRVHIRNARNIQSSPKNMLLQYGFTKVDVTCALRPDEYFDRAKIEKIWYAKCIDIVRNFFSSAARIEILEHATRVRDPNYPLSGLERHEYTQNQPSDYVHIDYTSESAEKSGIRKFRVLVGAYQRIVALNIWKPIRGPIYDWPLCLCDRRTVDYERNIMPMDIVTENYINENTRLHFDPGHAWYYWPALEAEEAIIFIQSDSDAKDQAGVPHTAFECPRPEKGFQHRQSIETRIFVYF